MEKNNKIVEGISKVQIDHLNNSDIIKTNLKLRPSSLMVIQICSAP